jgi:hypothetical protein
MRVVAFFILQSLSGRLEEHCWRYVKFLAQPANVLLGQFTLAAQKVKGKRARAPAPHELSQNQGQRQRTGVSAPHEPSGIIPLHEIVRGWAVTDHRDIQIS